MTEDIKLNKAEKAWKPSSKRTDKDRGEEDADGSKTQVLAGPALGLHSFSSGSAEPAVPFCLCPSPLVAYSILPPLFILLGGPCSSENLIGSCVFSAPSPHQDLFRRVRAILNKLTPQMFQQLMKQVTQLAIDTEERLKGVIDLIFEKAISEPNFSVAYANMCRCLMAVSFHCFLSLVVWPPTQ